MVFMQHLESNRRNGCSKKIEKVDVTYRSSELKRGEEAPKG